jgi:hypothetical protein
MTLPLSVVVLWKQKRMYFALASLSYATTNRSYPICFLLFKEVISNDDTVAFTGSFVSAPGAVLALASLSNVTTNRNYSICFL